MRVKFGVDPYAISLKQLDGLQHARMDCATVASAKTAQDKKHKSFTGQAVFS